MEEYYSPSGWVSLFPCIDELNQSFEAKLSFSSMREPAEAIPENSPSEYNSEQDYSSEELNWNENSVFKLLSKDSPSRQKSKKSRHQKSAKPDPTFSQIKAHSGLNDQGAYTRTAGKLHAETDLLMSAQFSADGTNKIRSSSP